MNHLNIDHRQTRQKKRSLVSAVSQITSGAIGAAGLVVAAQAVYVALNTPRLQPPPNSGHDFEKDGLLIRYTSPTTNTDATNTDADSCTDSCTDTDTASSNFEEDAKSEFRLVLVGDSPIEGIGNKEHLETLGGQTALAFSKLFRRSVRYWSYGKCGLTARGVEDEMVPLVQRLSRRYTKIDAIVVMCGVNNVLSGHSADHFGKEVRGLLDSLVSCCPCPIIIIDLIDFRFLPFLPFPLSKILSWRSQALQTELEAIVNGYGEKERLGHLISMAHMPDVPNTNNDSLLLENSSSLEPRASLSLDHFFADDNFHPALLGNALIGKSIVNAYTQLLRLSTFQDDQV